MRNKTIETKTERSVEKAIRQYKVWLEKMKEKGRVLISYACPSGEGSIETLKPPRGEVWDSAAVCPHCESIHFKVIRHNSTKAWAS